MDSDRLICVVDDQADLRFILQKLFAMTAPQYVVRSLDSGQALLNELACLSSQPSLIVMDFHMPVLDGYQTLQRLKKHEDHMLIPVVMMSAEASQSEILDFYRAGANSFIRKPITFDAQLDIVTLLSRYWLEANQKAYQPLGILS